ncbi:hypothetical protein D3C86_899630 [compost metagenome]
MIDPDAIRPGVSMICRIERAVTDLPEPLSPTTQRVLPGSMEKDRSLTARKTPFRTGNSVTRLRTSSSGLAGFMERMSLIRTSLIIGIGCIAQAVTEQIERHDGNDNSDARQEQPRRGCNRTDILRLAKQHAPGNRRRLETETEE